MGNSNSININDKAWGTKIKHHFYLITAVKVAITSLLLASVIDYIQLPRNAPGSANIVFITIMVGMVAKIIISFCDLLFLLFPNKLFCLIASIFLLFLCIIDFFLGLYNYISTGQTEYLMTPDALEVYRKYYGRWTSCSGILVHVLESFADFYFIGYLFYLGFFYTPKTDLPTIPVPNSRQTAIQSQEIPENSDSSDDSEVSDEIEIEIETPRVTFNLPGDDEEKICSRRSSRRERKSSKSPSNSTKSQSLKRKKKISDSQRRRGRTQFVGV